jgi:hypothetical protein
MPVDARELHVQCRAVSDVENFYALIIHAGNNRRFYLDFELTLSYSKLATSCIY